MENSCYILLCRNSYVPKYLLVKPPTLWHHYMDTAVHNTEASGLLKALPFAFLKKIFFLLGPFLDSFLGISLSLPGQRAHPLKIMPRAQYACLHE